MNHFATQLWQFNIELSLLLLLVLSSRTLLRRSGKNYNAYLLWLSVPVGLFLAFIMSNIDVATSTQFANELLTQGTIHNSINDYVIEPSSTLFSWSPIFMYGWITISLLLLLRLFNQHLKLRNELKNIAINNNRDCFPFISKYNIKLVEKANFSPAVYGYIQPTIYFPLQLTKELNKTQIELIIQHEEQHIKQKHLWLNLIWDLVVCLMWFNPFIYLSRQRFRHDQELFCDYLVLQQCSNQNKLSYGHALLSTVSATHSVSLLCSWKSYNQLEERIMNIKKNHQLNNLKLIALLSAVILACTSLYAVSATETDEKTVQTKVFKYKHSDDKDNASEIEMKINNMHFIEKNGKRYAVEDGIQRDMTKEESEQFDSELATAKKYKEAKKMHSKGDGHHRKVHIIKDTR